jgi:hypothetical protein
LSLLFDKKKRKKIVFSKEDNRREVGINQQVVMIMFDADGFYRKKRRRKSIEIRFNVEDTYVHGWFDSASISKGKLIDKRQIC